MSDKGINLRDEETLVWRKIFKEPNIEDYKNEDGHIDDTSLSRALELWKTRKHIQLGIKSVSPDRFAEWPDINDQLQFEEITRVQELRVKYADFPKHPCHEEKYQTTKYRQAVIQVTRDILKDALGGSKGILLKGKEPLYPEDQEKVINGLLRTGLGDTAVYIAMGTQVPSAEDFFTSGS